MYFSLSVAASVRLIHLVAFYTSDHIILKEDFVFGYFVCLEYHVAICLEYHVAIYSPLVVQFRSLQRSCVCAVLVAARDHQMELSTSKNL